MTAWLTLAQVADALHVSTRWARELVRPYRDRCHIARRGDHPRLLLWIPHAVLTQLLAERQWYAPDGVLGVAHGEQRPERRDRRA